MTFALWYLIVFSVLSLAYGYIGWRLIPPLHLALPWHILAWIFLSVIFLITPLISFLNKEGFEKTERFFTWAGYISLGFISFLFTFLLIKDVIWLLSWLSTKLYSLVIDAFKDDVSPVAASDLQRRLFLINSLNLGIIAASASLTGYGIFEARRRPAIIEHAIKIPGLPASLQDLRIVQITDIHAGLTVKRDWIETIVREVNALSPDIIAFTGDLADGSVEQLKNDVAPFAELNARYARYFVTGNHEYYSGALPWVDEALRLDFDVLNNENRILQIGSAKIFIAGVTDFSAGQFVRVHTSDPKTALRTDSENDFRLFLAHQPRSVFEAAAQGFDLMICGHTHGGQFFPWNLVATLGQPFISGLHNFPVDSGAGLVYVSKGTGYWGPPVRLAARSEITVFRLITA